MLTNKAAEDSASGVDILGLAHHAVLQAGVLHQDGVAVAQCRHVLHGAALLDQPPQILRLLHWRHGGHVALGLAQICGGGALVEQKSLRRCGYLERVREGSLSSGAVPRYEGECAGEESGLLAAGGVVGIGGWSGVVSGAMDLHVDVEGALAHPHNMTWQTNEKWLIQVSIKRMKSLANVRTGQDKVIGGGDGTGLDDLLDGRGNEGQTLCSQVLVAAVPICHVACKRIQIFKKLSGEYIPCVIGVQVPKVGV